MFAKIGTGELIIILIVALLVVGPSKLPALAKSVGQAIRTTKAYMRDMVGDVADDVADIQKDLNSLGKEIKDTEDYINNPLTVEKDKKMAENSAENSVEPAQENAEPDLEELMESAD